MNSHKNTTFKLIGGVFYTYTKLKIVHLDRLFAHLPLLSFNTQDNT